MKKYLDKPFKEYNDQQTRKDRKINCYYNKIKHDKRKHPVYEYIVQIGNRNDTSNNAELEKQALIRYAQTWAERNPNLHLISAYIHCDKPDGTVIKRDFETIALQTTKITIVKKVVVSESELHEVENQAK
ncbi:MAG: plasmid recombination protein [Ruminococcus sp.]